jgi:hypothetical protein
MSSSDHGHLRSSDAKEIRLERVRRREDAAVFCEMLKREMLKINARQQRAMDISPLLKFVSILKEGS